ncbi:hypothetical protein NLO413_0008 [Candidatus Neoehrlichia lotoris str. RAC413]|uniref:Uncharacterized protein n=1 Tax=Candidatus Neoehrlichia procyonis str. RAC413 TaxID=1359163 RepID=A0A0F3NKS1_9RICK|nr:hypothetical protein NLO413_0008 [Candidatus Neoehrlichia lotoris str. RAC413]
MNNQLFIIAKNAHTFKKVINYKNTINNNKQLSSIENN